MALTKVGPAGIGSTPGNGITIGDSFLHTTGLDSTNAKFTGIVTAQTFRVLGNFQVDGTTTTLDTEVTSVDKLEVAANNTTVGVAITQSGSGDILNLYDGSTEVFTVTDGGTIGIGTVVPNAPLDVFSNTSATDKDLFMVRSTTGAFAVQCSSIAAANPEWRLRTYAAEDIVFSPGGTGSSGEKVRIKSNGKVGVGINSPIAKLHLVEATEGESVIQLNSGDSYPTVNRGLKIKSATGPTGYAGSKWIFDAVSSGGQIQFQTVSAQRLTIRETGKIGINTDNPISDLHVITPGQNEDGTFRVGGSAAGLGLLIDYDQNGNTISKITSNPTYTNSNSLFKICVDGDLNADQLVLKGDGNIGIGIDNPPAKLSVDGSVIFGNTTSSGSGGTLRIVESGNAVYIQPGSNTSNDSSCDLIFSSINGATEKLRIDSSGRLLLGTTSVFGGGSVGELLQVGFSGGSRVIFGNTSSSLSNGTLIGQIDFNTKVGGTVSTGAAIKVNCDGSAASGDAPSRLTLHTTADGAASPTERLRITSDGKVGIGDNDPSDKLSVKGNSTTSSGIFIHNANGATNSSADLWFGNWSGSSSGVPQARISALNKNVNTAATDLIFQIYDGNNTLERLRIISNGNVGINQASPSEKLEVYAGDILLSSNANGYSGGVGPNAALKFEYNGHQYAKIVGNARDSSGYGDIDFYTSSSAGVSNLTQRMTIRADGKVGINDTNPAYQLSIEGTGAVRNEITCTDNNGAGAGVYFRTMNGGSMVSNATIRTDNAGNLQFYTGTSSDSERLRINSSGDLQFSSGNNIQMASNGRIFVGNGGNATDPMFANVSDTNTGIAFPAADTMMFTTGGSERLRITSDGIVKVDDIIQSPNIQHTPFILTASEKAVELWQHSNLSYSSSEEAFKFNSGSGYLSKSFFFGYNIDGAKGYDFEITGKNVLGRFYMKLYYSDGTDSGNWSINAWNPTSFSRNTISVPTNKKVRGFHINTSSSTSGYELYIKEVKIRRKSTDTNAPRDINVPDPTQFLNVMGGLTGARQAVRSLSGYTAGGSKAAGFLELAASSGNNNVATGLNVNASNAGGAMMVLATRNTSNATHTDAGMYLLMFRYDGNHVPNVIHIGGDNFCSFGKNGSNYLTVNCGSGNWCVSGFFAGYGIGNQMH